MVDSKYGFKMNSTAVFRMISQRNIEKATLNKEHINTIPSLAVTASKPVWMSSK
jgi:hypothetical protein